MEGICEQFWASTAPTVKDELFTGRMNRSDSEWAFQQYIQASAAATSPSEIKEQPNTNNKQDLIGPSIPAISNNNAAASASTSLAVDSEQYQALLKSKLNLACAAVALTRVHNLLANMIDFFLICILLLELLS